MARDDYYTIRSDPNDANHFTVNAVDSDYNHTKTYQIHGSVCDCWAGHKWCRHKQVLVKFKKERLLNSNKYWNFDKEKWLPPLEGQGP